MEGCDVHKNAVVDYGNRQYRAVLLHWMQCEHDIRLSLGRASHTFRALDPMLRDTPGALDRQGDVVEIIMAACRGSDNYGIRSTVGRSNAAWREAYERLVQLCRSIDYLFANMLGSHLKLRPHDAPCRRMTVDGCEALPVMVANSSFLLARIADTLVV